MNGPHTEEYLSMRGSTNGFEHVQTCVGLPDTATKATSTHVKTVRYLDIVAS